MTDITEIARAAEASGADSVSLINTLLGMAVDAEKRRPVLSTITGGMSGAAVKPIALRMVWQVAKAVNIPVIGLGGYHGMEGCCGVYASRCHRNTDRYCQLHRSNYYCQSFRRNK